MVFAAFMTPGGDFVSLPLVTGFMYGLYELAIWVGMRVEKKREDELEDWDDEQGSYVLCLTASQLGRFLAKLPASLSLTAFAVEALAQKPRAAQAVIKNIAQ